MKFLRRILRRCVDPNAPKEPLDADAQAEADGGDDEAPPDVESDDGSVAGSSPGGSSPHSSDSSQASLECRGGGNGATGIATGLPWVHRFPKFSYRFLH